MAIINFFWILKYFFHGNAGIDIPAELYSVRRIIFLLKMLFLTPRITIEFYVVDEENYIAPQD